MLSLEYTNEEKKLKPRTFYIKRHREWQSTIERAAQMKKKKMKTFILCSMTWNYSEKAWKWIIYFSFPVQWTWKCQTRFWMNEKIKHWVICKCFLNIAEPRGFWHAWEKPQEIWWVYHTSMHILCWWQHDQEWRSPCCLMHWKTIWCGEKNTGEGFRPDF